MLERRNQTLFEEIWMLLTDSDLPKSFLGKLTFTANYLINLWLNKDLKSSNFKMAFERLYDRQPIVKHFKKIWCLLYLYSLEKSKFAWRALWKCSRHHLKPYFWNFWFVINNEVKIATLLFWRFSRGLFLKEKILLFFLRYRITED